MSKNDIGRHARQATLDAFQQRIGAKFKDQALLDEALTHSSFANEYPHLTIANNQRLEFLGDAIVGFLVGEWLYLRYPNLDEGELTSIRAHIVCTENLATFAQEIDLGNCLRMGRGEAATGGAERLANLCAGFEALVGAIYLDQGVAMTRSWLHGFLERHALAIDRWRQCKDPKTLLQEHVQEHLHVAPWYQIVQEKGPAHARIFTAEVIVGQDTWGMGIGASKQAAEQAAAQQALQKHPSP